ncbi:hypothetical protein DSOL_4690 [Desulfosporosinus metallidurans]|uniref:Uncharacterized protein n=1 Tax=Desulfosporosinus metallidurans TaxID=1888891 RepID=A0A1Q8QIS6_9FIRM|nr:hypothetical protein DSOL_4690 [Desulfosporosinus metallidurans]
MVRRFLVENICLHERSKKRSEFIHERTPPSAQENDLC